MAWSTSPGPSSEPRRRNVLSPAPAGDPALLATVVVVSYNGVDLVAPCLEALAAQDLPEGRMQVWVVDNASTDGTQELIERDFPWVRLIANQRNDGFAGGNNVALRQVDTPYVALLNQDARPTRDWLSRLIEPFEREQAGRIYQVTVDGRDVTDEVLWDHLAYGPEGEGDGRFRWTRPSGRLLVPVDPDGRGTGAAPGLELGFRLAAEGAKPVELTWAGGAATVKAETEVAEQQVPVAPGAELVDVLNNAGSVVFVDGYGADRGYQEVDRGQYERVE